MCFAFVITAKTIGAHGLHDPDIDVCVEVLHERVAIESNEAGERIEVAVKEFSAQIGRQIGLRVIQQRSDIVLKRSLPAALIIEEKRMTVAPHDVSRLEIAIHEVIAVRVQEESS